jgi:hypothetical protein
MLPLEIGEEEGLEVGGMVELDGGAAVELEVDRLGLGKKGGERGMEEEEEREHNELELAHCLVENVRESTACSVNGGTG